MPLTREICKACNQPNPVGFTVPDQIWEMVVPRHLSTSILCIACFARLGDEKFVQWETEIQLFPVSLATHHGLKTITGEGGVRCWLKNA